MAPEELVGTSGLNESQQRRLLVSCQYIDRQLSEIESILTVAASGSPFGRYTDDLSPTQNKLLHDYVARIRSEMLRILKRHGLNPAGTPIGATHAIRTGLGFVDIAIEELRPKYMRGYGALAPELVPELNGLAEELKAVVRKLDASLAQGPAADLEKRLTRLERAGRDVGVLKTLERVIGAHRMVEFRPALEIVLDRLEERRFEIAVFGRVSSGKSSLLNRMLGTDVLPVGVTPITAVPTRIVHGTPPGVEVSFADRRPERAEIGRLREFATEQENPGNAKHVTRIVVSLPSSRLADGIVFVDTPGLGSLATSGAAQTLAYLPRCDLGLVLIDATAPLTSEDLSTIQRLYEAAIPARVVLSKADLLSPQDLANVTRYAEDQLRAQLRLDLPMHPVSVVEGHERLIDEWVDRDLRGLLAEHATLAARSLERKIGALRAAVEAGLRWRLEHAQHRRTAQADELPPLEAELRRAAASFEEARLAWEPLRDTPQSLIDGVLAAAARNATHALLGFKARGESPAGAVRAAVASAAAERGEEVRNRLGALAERVSATLARTAHALALPAPSADDDWTTVAREMPQIDLGALQIDLRLLLLGAFGPAIARSRVERALRARVGSTLSEALRSHGVLLHGWAIRVLGRLRQQFEAQAQVYRTHIGGLTEEGDTPDADRTALSRDLEQLAVVDSVGG